jgi:hypothetical protein
VSLVEQLRILNFGLREKTMERVWIDRLEVNLKSPFRNLKSAILLSAMLFALCSSAEAQQMEKLPRIGILLPWSPASGVSLSFLKAFHEGLHELGYVEGQNLAIEYRYAEGMSERCRPTCLPNSP